MQFTRKVMFAVSIASMAVLAACSSGENATGISATATPSQAASPAPAAKAAQYHATLALAGKPEVTADGQNIIVVVNVTNDGSGTYGSSTEPHNVNLGAHSIDTSGKVVNLDLARGKLPQVAPGATVTATILLPVAATLGHRVELLPVQEGVAWFDQWGTKPLIVGPFEACNDSALGKVCDVAGKALPFAPEHP